MTQSLAQAIIRKWGNLPYFKQRAGGAEFSAACPVCGTVGHQQGTGKPDRFVMFATGGRPRGWCRRCGHFAFADKDNYSEIDHAFIEAERRRLARLETMRMRQRISRLQEMAIWQRFNEQMTEDHREQWRLAGIADPIQDWFCLGACTRENLGDALTIPYWNEGKVVNLQYRLLDKEAPSRYLFTKGLPAPLFFTERDSVPNVGRALLVEGAKKGIVTWLSVGAEFQAVNALPSTQISNLHVQQMTGFDQIYIALDPGAEDAAHRAAQKLGPQRCLIVSLPGKPDDLITQHGFTKKDMMSFINMARPA